MQTMKLSAVICYLVQERNYTLLGVQSFTFSRLKKNSRIQKPFPTVPTITKLNIVVQRPFHKPTSYPKSLNESLKENRAHTTYTVTPCFKRRSSAGIEKTSWQHHHVSEVRLAVQVKEEVSWVVQPSRRPVPLPWRYPQPKSSQFSVIPIQGNSGLPKWKLLPDIRSGVLSWIYLLTTRVNWWYWT